MSIRLVSSTLLKLAFVAFMAPQFAFSTGRLEMPSDLNENFRGMVAVPAPEALSFEGLPSDIINLILASLSKKDLLSLREVDKKLRGMVTLIVADVGIPRNLPNEGQVTKFFDDLVADKFWEEKKPSEAFMNLFRHAPIEILNLPNKKIDDKKIATIAPAFLIGLKKFDLGGNKFGASGIQALAPYLSVTLQELWLDGCKFGASGIQALAPHFPAALEMLNLSNNNIEDAGFSALLEALPRTNVKQLSISVPFSSPFREQFKSLFNQQGELITVNFESLEPPLPAEEKGFYVKY